jgi:hypothetical protein
MSSRNMVRKTFRKSFRHFHRSKAQELRDHSTCDGCVLSRRSVVMMKCHGMGRPRGEPVKIWTLLCLSEMEWLGCEKEIQKEIITVSIP